MLGPWDHLLFALLALPAMPMASGQGWSLEGPRQVAGEYLAGSMVIRNDGLGGC